MKHRIRRVEQITITEYFLIVTLLSLAVVLSGCEKKKQDDEKFDVELNFNKYNAAVFERNNNIYFYEKSDQYFTPIGDLTRLKAVSYTHLFSGLFSQAILSKRILILVMWGTAERG